ncbi:hypothetical protein RJ640_003448 [Escallonia rubra]|uniref:Ubiquitin-specific protease family C19-related protein n=1 Tax=Escallonia rubra TaxID=112253 RepID=A0AA88QKK6_9ASTE|nr:hypothetical protein RJ640_003448 [Escallonia rubra]
MGSRFPSHQLSNGLYVSGRAEQPKERTPTMSSTAVPYTGGDIKKSGELGKMFDITDGSRSRKSGPINNAPSRTGSFGGASSHQMMPNAVNRMGSFSSGLPGSASLKKTNSGPLNKHGEPMKKSSGPQGVPVSRQNSGPLAPALPTTGLITSGPLNASGALWKASGPLDSTKPVKLQSSSIVQNQAVTHLSEENKHTFCRSFPKLILWAMMLIAVMGLIAGIFIVAAVGNPILLVAVIVVFAAVAVIFAWNSYWGAKAITDFIAHYPDTELRTAKDGQFVKVSGMVTCGSFPLESAFKPKPRCVYKSTSLYEKAANTLRSCCSWGLRSVERHVVDFYISDFQSGLRALVKTGHGARVTPYVNESVVIDINQSNRDMSPEFVRWLGERNLSCDDRVMRLKEGCIQEGSTVSVMGVVQRNDNVLMIVPPPEPISIGCQWAKCILPASLEGIVLICKDSSTDDAIPV